MTTTYNSVKEVLTKLREDLIEAKSRLAEREKEIETDLRECEMALKAIEPEKEMPDDYIANPEKKVGRVPKVGDVLVCVEKLDFIQINEEFVVSQLDVDFVEVNDKHGKTFGFFQTSIQRHFRFKDEPTTENN